MQVSGFGAIFVAHTQMSGGESSSAARSKHRATNGRGIQYDQVPVESHEPGGNLQTLQDCQLALSADPLPPPPLPLSPPFGTDFFPSDSEEPVTALELRPVRRFIPDSWKNIFKNKRETAWEEPISDINYISGGERCSPPRSPSLPASGPHGKSSVEDAELVGNSYRDPYGGSGGSYNSKKEADAMIANDPYGSLGRQTQTVKTYSERVEEYNLRYSYMKSWAGLLRILGVVELLLGAGVLPVLQLISTRTMNGTICLVIRSHIHIQLVYKEDTTIVAPRLPLY
ncbi:unnamed protein product [Ranitomeya imitator]|uniref:Uncharacterized protein n=1 Tax=Ranitomeya imitator TaxID=111125 RepID=A0ABN9L2W9_9NEOB|nr:unnamed protein product [Ranitomeya imitator]